MSPSVQSQFPKHPILDPGLDKDP
ncbi:hypothetical protein LINPERPRIM_LOCUS14176 [Linum perenne]